MYTLGYDFTKEILKYSVVYTFMSKQPWLQQPQMQIDEGLWSCLHEHTLISVVVFQNGK